MSTPTQDDLPSIDSSQAGNVLELSEIAQQAARIGGATLLHWLDRFETQEKGPADLVTDADVNAQRAIKTAILGVRPLTDSSVKNRPVKETASRRRPTMAA